MTVTGTTITRTRARTIPSLGLKAPAAEVEFKGLFKVRLLLGDDGRKRIVPTEIAEALGLEAKSFRNRVHRRFSKGCCMMTLPSQWEGHHDPPIKYGGDSREVLTLDLRLLPALLLTAEPARVRREIRPRLEEIQEELYDALAAYTFEGVAVNPAFGADRALNGQVDQAALAVLDELDRRDAELRDEMRERFARLTAQGDAFRASVEALTAHVENIRPGMSQFVAGIVGLAVGSTLDERLRGLRLTRAMREEVKELAREIACEEISRALAPDEAPAPRKAKR